MKAKLEFNLPDDQHDFDFAVNGSKWYCVAWDLDQWLRSEIKYNEEIAECDRESFEIVRDKLRDLMFDQNVKF